MENKFDKDWIDGFFKKDLTDFENNELKISIEKNDESIQQMLALFREIKLKDKQRFFDKLKTRKKVSIPFYWASIAASLLIFFLIYFFKNDSFTINDREWTNYSAIEKLRVLNFAQRKGNIISQNQFVALYVTEPNVNVKLLLLDFIQNSKKDNIDFSQLLKNENLPVVQISIVNLAKSSGIKLKLNSDYSHLNSYVKQKIGYQNEK